METEMTLWEYLRLLGWGSGKVLPHFVQSWEARVLWDKHEPMSWDDWESARECAMHQGDVW
jgi:hypothetical protein